MSYASDRDDWDTASELGFRGLTPDASATAYSDQNCIYIAGCRWTAGCACEQKCIGEDLQ